MRTLDDKSIASLGLAGVVVWQVHSAYSSTAPSLADLRDSHRDTTASRQALLDCDVLVGGLTFAAGGLAWWATGSVVPMLLIAASFLAVAGYYHVVLHGPTVQAIETGA